MKKAFDSYLAGGKGAPAEEAEGPGREAFDAMFGEVEDEDEMGDPLAAALESAGFDVDESKLTQIRSILAAKSEGEAKPLAGEETPEEESLEAKVGGGGAVPAAMSKMAGRKF